MSFRERLGEAQNWRCGYCGCRMSLEAGRPDRLTREHVQPRAMGGENGWENAIAACAACNSVRGRLYGFIFLRLRRDLARSGVWPPGTWAPRAASRRVAQAQRLDRAGRALRRARRRALPRGEESHAGPC